MIVHVACVSVLSDAEKCAAYRSLNGNRHLQLACIMNFRYVVASKNTYYFCTEFHLLL